VGNLQEDTEVAGSAGSYSAKVSPDWDLWTPNGGYLSAIALRAAAAETEHKLPIAYYCHYLSPASSGQNADLSVTTLRHSKRTQAMRVEMIQDEKRVLEAMVWAATPDGGVDFSEARMPEVPPHSELRTSDEIHAPDKPPFPFWYNLEGKPVTWTKRWEDKPIMHPLWRAWSRFRPLATFDDPYVDAARSLILIDTMLYPAAALTGEGPFPFAAPSMDLAVRFHRRVPDSDWLLTSTESPVAVDGIIGGYAAVWSENGDLVATGGQQMIAR
jgi:acyl-CoA thioesterase II